MEQFSYITVLSRFDFYDIRFKKFLLFFDDDESHTLDITTCDSPGWGMPSPLVMKTPETYPLPNRLEIRWVAALEGRCFEISAKLDQAKAEDLWNKQSVDFPDDPFRQYVIGVGPHGGVAVWLCSDYKSVLLHWLIAEEKALNEKELELHTPDPEMEVFTNAIMPPKKLQSNMRQYHYRFVPLEEYYDGEKWMKYGNNDSFYEEMDLDGVEVKRLDGTFDYTDSDDLMRYHEAGKPQRITVKWREGNASYLAHFWLDETESTFFFDGFSNTFPNAHADLLLRIDSRANCYEIAMTSEGLPVRRFKNVQFIVLKDYVEIARSKHYTKKDGEWRWS